MLQIIRKWNQGSLLQRTLLHVALFVAGSASVVALSSVVLVSTAKALLPPHGTTDPSDRTSQEEDVDPDAPSSPEASADPAGARGSARTIAQVRPTNRREAASVQ